MQRFLNNVVILLFMVSSITVAQKYLVDQNNISPGFKENSNLTAAYFISTQTVQEWEQGNWANTERYQWEYNQAGSPSVYSGQNWDNGAWVNEWRYNYEYGPQGWMSVNTYQQMENNAWEDVFRYQYTYDANGYQSEMMKQDWTSGSWNDSYQLVSTNDANGNVIEENSFACYNNIWTNSGRYFYQYDGNGDNTLAWGEYWTGNEWTNSWKTEYTYHNGEMNGYTSYQGVGSEWNLSSKFESNFNGNGKMSEGYYFTYNNGWAYDRHFTKEYDDNGNLSEKTTYAWNTNSNLSISGKTPGYKPVANWVEHLKETFTYVLITDVEEDVNELPVEFKLSQNYPNPFNPQTKITFDLPVQSDVVIKIYNSLGEEVVELINSNYPAGQYNVIFDAAKFGSGVYFYSLSVGNYMQTKKMILLK